MLQRRFLSFFLVLCIWLSAAGFLAEQAHAAVSLQTSGFGKISPEPNASISTSRVTLTWEAGPEPGMRYEYCMFSKQNCPAGQWKPVGTSTSATVNVKANTTYYWQVRARSTSGSLTYADSGTQWKFITVPAAPSAFNKSGPAIGATDMPLSVTLTWTPSTGLNVNYQVCYDTTDNNQCESGIWLLAGTNTAYMIKGLNYGTTYFWQVRAYNSKSTVYADGSAASFRSFTTRIAPPTPFVKLSPANEAGGQPTNINLVWSASTGTNITYEYCLVAGVPGASCEASGGTWTSTGAATFASPTLTLAYDTIYFWQVRARNNIGDAVEANSGTWWSFHTLLSQPTDFEKLLPLDGAMDVSRTPYLYWAAVSTPGLTYEYCLVEQSQTCSSWTNVGASTYTKISTPLEANTTYTWQVRSKDGDTVVAEANGATAFAFTTLPDAPVWIVEPLTTPEDLPYANSLRATNPGSKTLLYTLAGREPAGDFQLYPDGSFTYTPEPEFSGSVTFSFTIWDGVNEPTGPHTATITVTPVNDAPVIVPIADVSVFTGSDIFFTVETSDPDLAYGDTLTITLTGTLPTGAAFTTSYDPTTHAASADFEWVGAVWLAAHPGPYELTLTVTDGKGAAATDPFTIRVEPNTLFVPLINR